MTAFEEEIRAAQEANIADVERQLAEGRDPIVSLGHELSREAAWAATTSIRKCWELGGRYSGQELAGDGSWLANVQIPIGRFPG